MIWSPDTVEEHEQVIENHHDKIQRMSDWTRMSYNRWAIMVCMQKDGDPNLALDALGMSRSTNIGQYYRDRRKCARNTLHFLAANKTHYDEISNFQFKDRRPDTVSAERRDEELVSPEWIKDITAVTNLPQTHVEIMALWNDGLTSAAIEKQVEMDIYQKCLNKISRTGMRAEVMLLGMACRYDEAYEPYKEYSEEAFEKAGIARTDVKDNESKF